MDFLKRNLGNRLISMNSDFEWPPHSPDLNPLDFFQWGYLQDIVYAIPRPTTLREVKERVKMSIAQTPVQLYRKSIENMVVRCNACIQCEGGHFEHLL